MAVRRLMLIATFVTCLALASSAWAGTLSFTGFTLSGQGALSFTPGIGDALTIGAGNGGNGALVTDFMNTVGICGGDCSIVGGYLTLATGGETSGFAGGGAFSYTYGGGGSINIFGKIPSLGINVSSLLFTATLLPGSIFTGSGTVGSVIAAINLASIMLNPALGSYHYTGATNDELSFSISSTCGTGGICTGSLIQSTTALQIPEPATLSVLGVGMFAFGAGLRKKVLTR